MAKSKSVDGFLDACEKAISCLIDLVKIANECIDEFKKLKEEFTPTTKATPAPVKEEVKQPTLEEVRTILAGLSRRGYTTNVRMMLIGFGVSKLSEVDPKDYAELLAKAKELDDATKD